MLKLLQYHSLLWSKYENNDINVEVFREEMVTVGALSLSKKKLEEYNALLDTWFKNINNVLI